jgi:hypothetical protein
MLTEQYKCHSPILRKLRAKLWKHAPGLKRSSEVGTVTR